MSKEQKPDLTGVELSELDRPLSKADVLEIVREAVREFRKPSEKEETKAAQLERFRKQQREQIAAQDAAKKHVQSKCKHLRIDGTSCIGWMQNSDGVFRGVCMHCNKLFTPDDPDYERLREVSTLSPLQQAASAAIQRVSK